MPDNSLGDEVRDWEISDGDSSLFPYRDGTLIDLSELLGLGRWLWPCRTVLGNRATFARLTYFQEGRPWWEWHQITLKRLRTPLSIVFGEVATHNHFVLDRGGKVFKQTAPVIKLPPDASEDDHLSLLGILNSSTACFWLKQVAMGKHKGDGGEAHADPALQRFYFNATKVGNLPLPEGRPLAISQLIDALAAHGKQYEPTATIVQNGVTRSELNLSKEVAASIRGQMIALQEELDWECYRLYGLLSADLTYGVPLSPSIGNRQRADGTGQGDSPGEAGDRSLTVAARGAALGLELGQRAFEVVMARRMAAGELQTAWFERHGSTPITELPADWPDDYRRLVEQRIALIESDPNIRLMEQPEYKRRWNTEPWDSQLERALRHWLLDRLESYFDFDGRMRSADASATPVAPPLADVQLVSIARLADVARQDAEFLQVGELYRDDPAFDVQRLVEELVAAASVPLLPALRYKESGLRKRAEWEKTWELQRQEDAIDARAQLPETDPKRLTAEAAVELKRQEVGAISVPPKYDSKDFQDAVYWRLRGKLDVPKERWSSFPHCQAADGTPVVAWAGYDHLQMARAVSAYYVDVQERLGGRNDSRLAPLLACLQELLPWLRQWHHAIDPEFGQPMDQVFEGFVAEEAKQLGLTLDQLRAWQPLARAARGAGKRKAKA